MKSTLLLAFAALQSASPVGDVRAYDIKLSIQRKIWTGRTEYFMGLTVNGQAESHCNLAATSGLTCNSQGTTFTIHEINPSFCSTMVSWKSRAFVCIAKFQSEQDSWFTPKYTNYLCTKKIEAIDDD
ncbi:hypothetical protein DSO57_1020246 [Entomophthora muscae]|uniref:Uncharacterized protein n=1 Tax=Entomophthora muscae TaxID=34485 RepID=A0ACC2TER5_9FUNG|nr:hypothetical protein DSO57_1020246 [Entomophthora muscae]